MDPVVASVLERLESESRLERSRDTPPEDRMLAITRDTGEFYNMLLRLSGARDVLEIGMSVGYSTVWFAEAVRDAGGHITTIEQNPSKIRRAGANFDEAGVSDIISIIQGTALDMLEGMVAGGKRFDFVFIDADKENVAMYFDLALAILNPGGVIGVDNMHHPERFREHMGEFDRHVRSHAGIQALTLHLGNGQELIRKI